MIDLSKEAFVFIVAVSWVVGFITAALVYM